ncbi:hypothetical protein [Rarobacter faecitabidus]|nr:hypothetical protein [Rarobacter faecitabidus]
MSAMDWYGVRSIIDYGGFYEERVVVFRATDFEDAIAQAERESNEYAEVLENTTATGFLQAYRMFDELQAGAEVYSLIRESDLELDDYLDRFFDNGLERQRTYEDDAPLCAKPSLGRAPITEQQIPGLVGSELVSVMFVLNDHLEIRFEDAHLTLYVWPVVRIGEREWRETDEGYADALRRLSCGQIQVATEIPGHGVRIELDTGDLVIDPRQEELEFADVGMIDVYKNRYTVWTAQVFPFEHLRSPKDSGEPAPPA